MGLNWDKKKQYSALCPIYCVQYLQFVVSEWCHAHQVFEECSDLPREHSQVQEACGDLVIILRQVTVPQIL